MDKNIAIGLIDTLADLTRKDWDIEQCRSIIQSLFLSLDFDVNGEELLKQFDSIISSESFVSGNFKPRLVNRNPIKHLNSLFHLFIFSLFIHTLITA